MKENKISLKGDNIHINMDNGSIADISISITSNATIPYAIYIYELITGYVECHSIYDKQRIELHSRGVLSELEKHYPCVKRIDRRGMPNIQIYPKNVDVHYEEDKDVIIITVKYNYTTTSFDIPNLSKIYSKMVSERYKLFCAMFFEMNLNEIKKKYGKYVEARPSTENDSKEKATIVNIVNTSSFDAITDELKDTYVKKNHDYGNSFDKSIDKFGLTAAVVRMSDKMERLNSLLNKDAKVDESIRDTVMDLANYCIMTAMYLDNKEKK